ncbi:branched chain alpha-keto acid dehydrogenase E1-alpha subunit [Phakopsora pachyrhizi]|nr:branched chain alpha-keto acid dehydrogenase E1-alpha subunit [Phakopsora pachyrhizi]
MIFFKIFIRNLRVETDRFRSLSGKALKPKVETINSIIRSISSQISKTTIDQTEKLYKTHHNNIRTTSTSTTSSTSDSSSQQSQIDRFKPIETLKVLDSDGSCCTLVDDSINLFDMASKDFCLRTYSLMVGLPLLDTTMNNLQRQGRISFYMTSYGEEGAVVGSAAAWYPNDEVFAQYREQGVLLWRGCSLDYLMSQCFSTASDESSLGRQMPIHYASKKFHFFSISSPLATQIPQAAGAAYALKRQKQSGERPDGCVICYIGEGAASEGDFHAGVNMASVLGGPIVFFIRNNGFAISTPANQQYKGDGIASRAIGYGIEAIRVDGNDPVAVYLASKEARRRATEGSGRAVMVEAMTYRVGHHSTSDDSSAYRNPNDVEQWRKKDNPIHRMRNYLENKGWWNQDEEDRLKNRWKEDIKKSIKLAENTLKPSLSNMWTDTYFSKPREIDSNAKDESDEEALKLEKHLIEQRSESNRIINKFKAYKSYREELLKFESTR